MNKQLDTWVRWSHRVNGWIWSVMDGAQVVEEGASHSYDEARTLAREAVKAQGSSHGKALVGVKQMDATPTAAQIATIRAKQTAFLRGVAK